MGLNADFQDIVALAPPCTHFGALHYAPEVSDWLLPAHSRNMGVKSLAFIYRWTPRDKLAWARLARGNGGQSALSVPTA